MYVLAPYFICTSARLRLISCASIALLAQVCLPRCLGVRVFVLAQVWAFGCLGVRVIMASADVLAPEAAVVNAAVFIGRLCGLHPKLGDRVTTTLVRQIRGYYYYYYYYR